MSYHTVQFCVEHPLAVVDRQGARLALSAGGALFKDEREELRVRIVQPPTVPTEQEITIQ